VSELKVLSIDGGGIRGIIPATVLAEVERRVGKPVAECFDLIAGTSTGGILALALSKPGAGGHPAWSAEALIGLYEQEGPQIFDRSVWHRITSAGGLLDEKYPLDGMERAFERYFGEVRLKDALCDVIVTSYEIEQRTTFFFKSAKAREDERDDFAMSEAALATSAAPTYFAPVRLDRGPGRPYLALVDGGVFANNPALSAFAETRRSGAEPDVLMLSLGTGELTRRLPYDDVKDWGLLEWAKPIIDVVFDGVSDAVDYQLRQLLGPGRYYRLQTELDQASDDMDDASSDNLQRLEQEAESLIRANEDRLDELCAKLA
jgi:patatin-like phospholipase/acyl hydrolase